MTSRDVLLTTIRSLHVDAGDPETAAQFRRIQAFLLANDGPSSELLTALTYTMAAILAVGPAVIPLFMAQLSDVLSRPCPCGCDQKQERVH